MMSNFTNFSLFSKLCTTDIFSYWVGFKIHTIWQVSLKVTIVLLDNFLWALYMNVIMKINIPHQYINNPTASSKYWEQAVTLSKFGNDRISDTFTGFTNVSSSSSTISLKMSDYVHFCGKLYNLLTTIGFIFSVSLYNWQPQGSHYFQIRENSDFSFGDITGRSGRQHREVGRTLWEKLMVINRNIVLWSPWSCPAQI